MIKAFFILLSFLPICFFVQNNVNGKVFPDISGETYDGKKVTIPSDTKGKYTLIGMAYSKDSEQDLKTWLKPVYNKFIAKTEMFDYDVNLFFIPMFTGTNALTADLARKELKKGTDKELFPYVLFYQGSLKKYKEELAFEKNDTPYFFVLDKTGKIIYATSGKFSDEKIEKIEDIIM